MDVDRKPNSGFTAHHGNRGAANSGASSTQADNKTGVAKREQTGGAQAVGGGIKAEEGVTYLELTQTHMGVHNDNQMLREDLDLRKRANELIIPTNDEHVKARLEELGEPIIFFGEMRHERRQRLRIELAKRGETEGMPKEVRELGLVADTADSSGPKRPFTTEGLEKLKEARLSILRDSIPRSQKRLYSMRARQNFYAKMAPEEWNAKLKREDENYFKPLTSVLPAISVVGDARPLTSIAFNGDGSKLATGSWNPVVKIWNPVTGAEEKVLKGHTDRVVGVSFSPIGSIGNPLLASCGADRTIRLWNVESGESVATLRGHDDRVNVVGWHPTGVHIFASSHDATWSMWDVSTNAQLLRQDGHSRGVFGLAVHPDGALLATGSVDASVRVWDVRSGEPAQTFTGHVRQVLSTSWHPEGVILATASEDHTVRVWDMRTRKALYTIPAHQSMVCGVKFAPHHGKYLVTAGYDHFARIYRTDDFSLLSTLSGHDSRLVSLDVSPAAPGSYLQSMEPNHFVASPHADPEDALPNCIIATASFDRTFKLWTPS